MCHFIESIKLQDGEFYRLELHQARVQKAFDDYFPTSEVINLLKILHQVDIPKTGIYKCRIVYDSEVRVLELTPYIRREIRNLKLVETDMDSIPYKTENRQKINEAFARRNNCDDVLLVKNSLLTDSSSCNIALWNGENWVTPRTPLIYGVNRAQLLAENKIVEEDIKAARLMNFQLIRLFNAMIEFGELELDINSIHE